jgi:hypothetical protein
MNTDNVPQVEFDPYALKLWRDQVCTDILRTLYLSFQLKYNRCDVVDPDSDLIHCDYLALPEGDTHHSLTFGTDNEKRQVLITLVNPDLTSYRIEFPNHTTHDNEAEADQVENAVNDIVADIVQKYFQVELTQGRDHFTTSPILRDRLREVSANEISHEPIIRETDPVGFCKQIKKIKESNTLTHLLVTCVDFTTHNIIVPRESYLKVKAGDWLSYDGKGIKVISAVKIN